MNQPYRDHPDEDVLERFLLSQSEEEELEVVETHIMACEACVTRLETLELDIAVKKLALRDMQAEQARKLANAAAPAWKGWFTLPRLSWTAAAMAACGLFITVAELPREITLTAARGTEISSVEEWRPVRLHLGANDLPLGAVGVEVINNDGAKVWQGRSVVKNEFIDVKLPRFTSAGAYFVRVYSVSSEDAVSEMEREYSLQVKPLF